MSKLARMEGVFAINKPGSVTSAQVVRNLQRVFTPSHTFASWIAAEESSRAQESHNQHRRRRHKNVQMKIGHGGTLDPLATGVLIIGVGKGTKELENFLKCTKTYEAVILFGAATDTYDITGRIASTAPYGHITRDKVEEALKTFRGNIMQKPPIYSARRMQGKHMYKYAREGIELPLEIQEKSVKVEELEITEWLEPGTHHYLIPEEYQDIQDTRSIGNARGMQGPESANDTHVSSDLGAAGSKRGGGHFSKDELTPLSNARKRHKKEEEENSDPRNVDPTSCQTGIKTTHAIQQSPLGLISSRESEQRLPCPPAVKVRMTVTSGFYVRSLCHDLGKALGSLGLMASLVRTRQGSFELGKNVLSYEDVEKEEERWGPKILEMLNAWKARPLPAEDSFNLLAAIAEVRFKYFIQPSLNLGIECILYAGSNSDPGYQVNHSKYRMFRNEVSST